MDSREDGPKRKETACQLQAFKTPEKWPMKTKAYGELTETDVCRLNWAQKVKDGLQYHNFRGPESYWL